MQRFKRIAERSTRWRRSALVLALLVAGAVGGVGQLGTVSMQTLPANPTTEEAIVLILLGEWKDSCVPSVKGVQVVGGRVTVYTESWPGMCLMVITSWRQPVSLGRLPAGSYTVTVVHSERGMAARVIGWGGFAVAGTACVPPRDRPPIPEGDRSALVAGSTGFAIDLYGQLREEEGNLFLSPYNIWLCLAMAHAGARGETELEMATALRFSLPQVSLHPALGALDLWLRAQAERTGVALTTGNAFWEQEGWPFRLSYTDLLAEHYRAELFEVPFATNPNGSRRQINAWVSDQTRAKIPELLPPGSVDPSTLLVLTSAIYFHGTWKYQFDPRLTSDDDFHLLDGSVVKAPMMTSGEISVNYAAGELGGIGYEAAELPYTCEAFSMVLVLPEKGRFGEFERALTAEGLAGILGRLRATELHVIMPKFTFRSKFSLAEALGKLGMRSAFSPEADFSGMEETRSVFISDVIHEAFIAVDEVGTEAAAATGTVFVLSMPKMLTLDRPFLFIIRERTTGTILFLGRVLDPRTETPSAQ